MSSVDLRPGTISGGSAGGKGEGHEVLVRPEDQRSALINGALEGSLFLLLVLLLPRRYHPEIPGNSSGSDAETGGKGYAYHVRKYVDRFSTIYVDPLLLLRPFYTSSPSLLSLLSRERHLSCSRGGCKGSKAVAAPV